jgi:type II secretory pathway pseudopilin PulG
MTHSNPIRRKARPAAIRRDISRDEQGYILLAAIFFLALLVITLAVAAPRIASAIQRDREVETFHRGMQYRRAIQLYYRKFRAYPPNVDALIKTNEIRFLRKKYIDPMTGKDDWEPVLYGQNKTPTAMGFFGQPLSGNATTIAGVGPSGGNGLGGNNGSTGPSTLGGSASPIGSSIFSSPDNGSGSTSTSGTSGSGTGSTGNNGGTSGSTGGTGSTTSGTSSSGSSGFGSTGGNGGTSGSSGSTGTASSGTSSSGSSGSGTGSGLTGQTFGGAGIIGFSPASPKQSILVYKKKNHYNEWEFTYDPLSDMQTVSGGNTGTVGQPASSTSSSVGSPTFGSPASSPSSSPSSPPPTTTPQPSSTATPQQ